MANIDRDRNRQDRDERDYTYARDAGYRGGGFLGGSYSGGTDFREPRETNFGLGVDIPRPSFRGIGPKNYERSDDRIREDVCERLSQDVYVDASDIDVTVSGVRDVQNNLRLTRS